MAKKREVKAKKSKVKFRQPAQPEIVAKKAIKDEKDKIVAMWTGVIFFMVLIFVVWTFTFRGVLKTDSSSEQGEQFNWQEIKQEFNQTIQEVKGNLGEIEKLRESVKEAQQTQMSEEQIEELKQKILDKDIVEENIATSSEEIINN